MSEQEKVTGYVIGRVVNGEMRYLTSLMAWEGGQLASAETPDIHSAADVEQMKMSLPDEWEHPPEFLRPANWCPGAGFWMGKESVPFTFDETKPAYPSP